MTLVRGPADPDAFRTKVYGARWYRDPLPADARWPKMADAVPAVTTIKNAWSKPFRKKTPSGLTVPLDAYWAAEYVVDNMTALAQMEPEAAMTMVATAPGRSLAKAADRGTAVHSIMEGLAAGVVLAPELLEPETLPFLPAALAFVEEWRPAWVMTEVVCINRGIGFGGTADALLVLPGYGLTLVDWKSRGSGHGAYAEEACQIGGYASADYFVVTDPSSGELVRIDPPAIEAGAVVSFTADDGYALYPVDIGEAKRSFLAMFETWRVRREGERDARAAIGSPAFPPKFADDFPPKFADDAASGLREQDVETDHDPDANGHARRDAGTPIVSSAEDQHENAPDVPVDGNAAQHPPSDMPEHLRLRVVAIAQALGTRGLPIPWPDVPKLSAGLLYTVDDLHAVDSWCWDVEAILGLPFPPAGPPIHPDERGQSEVAPERAPEVAEVPRPVDEALVWAERGRALLALLDDEPLARACAEVAKCDAVRMSRVRFLALQAVVTQVSAPAGVLRAGWSGAGPQVVAVDDIELTLVAAMPHDGDGPLKAEALRRARNVAKRLGEPAPRSYAALCADLLLAACVAVGHGVTGSDPNTTESGSG